MASFNCLGNRAKVSPSLSRHQPPTKSEYAQIPDIDYSNPNLEGLLERAKTSTSFKKNIGLFKNHPRIIEKLFSEINNELALSSSDKQITSICQSLMYGKDGNIVVERVLNQLPPKDREQIIEVFNELLATNKYGFKHEHTEKTKDKIINLGTIIQSHMGYKEAALTGQPAAEISYFEPVTKISNIVKVGVPPKLDNSESSSSEIAVSNLTPEQRFAKAAHLQKKIDVLGKLFEDTKPKFKSLKDEIALLKNSTEPNANQHLKIFEAELFNLNIERSNISNKLKLLKAALKQVQFTPTEFKEHYEQIWQPKLDQQKAQEIFKNGVKLINTDDEDCFAFGDNEVALQGGGFKKETNDIYINLPGTTDEPLKLTLPNKPENQNGVVVDSWLEQIISTNPDLVNYLNQCHNSDEIKANIVSLLKIGMQQYVRQLIKNVITESNKPELAPQDAMIADFDFKDLHIDPINMTLSYTEQKATIKKVNGSVITEVTNTMGDVSLEVRMPENPEQAMLSNGYTATSLTVNNQQVTLTKATDFKPCSLLLHTTIQSEVLENIQVLPQEVQEHIFSFFENDLATINTLKQLNKVGYKKANFLAEKKKVPFEQKPKYVEISGTSLESTQLLMSILNHKELTKQVRPHFLNEEENNDILALNRQVMKHSAAKKKTKVVFEDEILISQHMLATRISHDHYLISINIYNKEEILDNIAQLREIANLRFGKYRSYNYSIIGVYKGADNQVLPPEEQFLNFRKLILDSGITNPKNSIVFLNTDQAQNNELKEMLNQII